MQPQQPYAPPPSGGQQPNYDFIFNPAKPTRPGLLNGNSLKQRLVIAGAGLVILIIAVTAVINLLSGSSDYFPSVLAVAQQQQEIVHLTTAVAQNPQTKLNTANANLAVTLQLTVGSSQHDLLSYLKNNGHKVSSNQLNQKVSTAVDQQLTTAAQAGTYDATFDNIIQSQLQAYQQYLLIALAKDKGPKGQALLNSYLQQTKLLLASLPSGQSS